MMEIGEIQALFTHIKGLLPNCKSTPRLTNGMARSWCDAFEGYTLEQLKQAAIKNAKRKAFWPDIQELMAYLPVQDGDGNGERVAWPNNGYASAEEYVQALRELAEMGRLMAFDYPAAGLPHPAKARDMGWSVGVWNDKCREAMGKEGGGRDEEITAV